MTQLVNGKIPANTVCPYRAHGVRSQNAAPVITRVSITTVRFRVARPAHSPSSTGHLAMSFELSEDIFRSWIGQRVVKKSRKPFKSGNVVNTVKRFGLIHPITNRPCFEFEEDDSYVEARMCVFQP